MPPCAPAKVCRLGPCPKTQDVYAAGHRVHSLGRKVSQVARPSWSRTIRLTPFCIELADGHTAETHSICGGGQEEAGRLAVVAEAGLLTRVAEAGLPSQTVWGRSVGGGPPKGGGAQTWCSGLSLQAAQ